MIFVSGSVIRILLTSQSIQRFLSKLTIQIASTFAQMTFFLLSKTSWINILLVATSILSAKTFNSQCTSVFFDLHFLSPRSHINQQSHSSLATMLSNNIQNTIGSNEKCREIIHFGYPINATLVFRMLSIKKLLLLTILTQN